MATSTARGCTLPITLVYGQRSREELYYDDEFRALATQHPNFTYVPALSHEPEGSDWSGARGFVHEAAKAHYPNGFAGHKAYLCGPPPMVDAVTQLAVGRGALRGQLGGGQLRGGPLRGGLLGGGQPRRQARRARQHAGLTPAADSPA